MESGIYTITSRIDGRLYVGSAVLFQRRWNKHLSQLIAGTHPNKKIKAIYDEHGRDALVFRKLIVCAPTKTLLELYEQRAINTFDSYRNGLNCSPHGRVSALGSVRSPETRKRMSLGKIGRKMPAYAVEKVRQKMLGKPSPRKGVKLSDETKEKIRQKLLGRTLPPEHRAKLGVKNIGRKFTHGKLRGRVLNRDRVIRSVMSRSAVTPDLIRQIRALYNDGVKPWQIRDALHLGNHLVHDICVGSTYRWIV